MRLNLKKIAFSVFAAGLLTFGAQAQFEGIIEFEKNVGNVNVNYRYFVKGDHIRIEEVAEDGAVEGIQLINLTKKTMYAISPEQKLYMEAPNRRPAAEFKVEVERTGNSKEINGMKCKEIIVSSTEKDRKIIYWVAKGEYDFFIPMLIALNRKENQSLFFQKIEGIAGFFPMLSQEYILSSNRLVSELKATEVKAKANDASIFEIPSDYKKFER
jgi:hypothetical protein